VTSATHHSARWGHRYPRANGTGTVLRRSDASGDVLGVDGGRGAARAGWDLGASTRDRL